MSQSFGDLRVRRTHKLIRESLISLLEEKSFDSITVEEISQRAMVSRTTFYRYYQDKYQLVEDIFEDVISALMNDLDPLRLNIIANLDLQNEVDPWSRLFGEIADSIHDTGPLEKFFNHFAEYERMYSALLGERGSPWFSTKLQTFFANQIGARLQDLAGMLHNSSIMHTPAFSKGLVKMLVAGQILDMIRWWLKNGEPLTAEQMSRYCYRVVFVFLKDVATWE